MREEYYKDKLGEKENKEERRRENSLDIIVYRFVEHRPIETDSIEKFWAALIGLDPPRNISTSR